MVYAESTDHRSENSFEDFLNSTLRECTRRLVDRSASAEIGCHHARWLTAARQAKKPLDGFNLFPRTDHNYRSEIGCGQAHRATGRVLSRAETDGVWRGGIYASARR
jgi:hypothetical protein